MRALASQRRPKNKTLHIRIRPKQLMVLAALVLIMYVVVPQIGAFRNSLHLLQRADMGWVVSAALFYLCTGLASVGIYKTLLSGRLPLWRTVVVEYGSSFANRLLPAGVGAVGVNYLYFKKQRYATSTAVAVVTVNNVLGFVGHLILLLAIAVFDRRAWNSFTIPLNVNNVAVVIGSSAFVAVVLVLIFRHFQARLKGILINTLRQIAGFGQQPARLLLALLFSITITTLHALSLWASATALHVDVSIAQAIIVLAIGVGVGAIIPSPGGLGGAEAGLLAGLIACHIPAGSAIAVAILYRLVSYWLGFLVGTVAFFASEKRSYI